MSVEFTYRPPKLDARKIAAEVGLPPIDFPTSIEGAINQGIDYAVFYGRQAASSILAGSIVPGFGNAIAIGFALLQWAIKNIPMATGYASNPAGWYCVGGASEPGLTPLKMVVRLEEDLAFQRCALNTYSAARASINQCITSKTNFLTRANAVARGTATSATVPEVVWAIEHFDAMLPSPTKVGHPCAEFATETHVLLIALRKRYSELEQIGKDFLRVNTLSSNQLHRLRGLLEKELKTIAVAIQRSQPPVMQCTYVKREGKTHSICTDPAAARVMYDANLEQFKLASVALKIVNTRSSKLATAISAPTTTPAPTSRYFSTRYQVVPGMVSPTQLTPTKTTTGKKIATVAIAAGAVALLWSLI